MISLKSKIFLLPVTACLLAIYLAACAGQKNNSSGNVNPTTGASTTAASCNPSVPFTGGSGTVQSPYQVSTFCDLLSLANNMSYWSANFQMVNSIDLTGVTFNPMITFAGVFDGKGYSISNWSGSNAFFVFNSGTIQNLNLVNATIVPLGGARPATLVGTNLTKGVVLNCSASGSVNGLVPVDLDMDNDIYWFVGGLVSINAGSVTHSTANVAVSGYQSVGGLVGYNNGGTIQTSSAAGSVTAVTPPASTSGQGVAQGNGSQAGGLVGTHASGMIENSFAGGVVQGVTQVGGLVGYSESTIQDCFSYGAVSSSVSGATNIGGLVGQVSGGSTATSFWDTTASGQATSAAGTGEATAAMQNQATYAGWNFSTIWKAVPGGYPALQ